MFWRATISGNLAVCRLSIVSVFSISVHSKEKSSKYGCDLEPFFHGISLVEVLKATIFPKGYSCKKKMESSGILIYVISFQSVSKSFGGRALFEELSFTLSKGDQIGLIGPNGAGKSTLLKILMKIENPDTGFVTYKQNMRVGYSSQSPEFSDTPLVELLVHSTKIGDLHDRETRAEILLSKVGFTRFDQSAASLSGGWKKRLDIARALMDEPDLLLLDEPTNHLDLEGIEWLEQFLNKERLTYLLVSHDRYFLENCCSRIMELNPCYPGGILICEGSYGDFMEQKKAFLENQEQRQRAIASQVRSETDWLRRSPKARTTKSLSRIRRAYELMDELSGLKSRNKKEKVELTFEASERETRKLLAAKNLGKSLGSKKLFEHVDLTLSPKMRLGIVGANGTGKTTLLKMLAGEIAPDQGTIKVADDLKIVYFDQHRETVPLNITLREALSPNSDYVDYHGNLIHVNGWAKRFLFSPDRLNLPVSVLSGGERARILIARLMLKPADLLFLDEPTNDLDIPTLEVLEESLEEFPGAVVLVTHDRCLMDRVATHIIGLGTGCDSTLFADYAQWEAASIEKQAAVKKAVSEKTVAAPPVAKKKLSYNVQRELDGLPQLIESLEAKLQELHVKAAENATNSKESLKLYQEIAEAEQKIQALYQRWEELLSQ
jgi:ATP-binding cassette subfamily F protein uup